MLDTRGTIDALAHRRDQLEREIATMLPGSPWAVQVGRLRCLRGIYTLTAVGLCSEIADFERCARAEQLMSYVGLVPCESTTGQQRRLGAITKTGSGHARRLLVEAAWHYRKRPAVGRTLAERHDGQPAEAVAIRRRAGHQARSRLHRRRQRRPQAQAGRCLHRSSPDVGFQPHQRRRARRHRRIHRRPRNVQLDRSPRDEERRPQR
jgi:transposase